MSHALEFKTYQEDFGRGLAEWHSIGEEDKQKMFFLGANGQAASTYPFFLRKIAKHYQIKALENRAAWPNRPAPTMEDIWREFVIDYEHFLSFHKADKGGVTHLGHSFGASLGVLLAYRRPELFDRLVLVEPGMTTSRWQAMIFRMMSYKQRGENTFMKKTRLRQNEFASKQSFMDIMRTKKNYQGFCEEAMQDYADGGLVQAGDQYKLKFSGVWESHNFCDAHYLLAKIVRLKVPTLVLFSDNSYVLKLKRSEAFKKHCEQRSSNVEVKILKDIGHFCIQENPDYVASEVLNWLGKQ